MEKLFVHRKKHMSQNILQKVIKGNELKTKTTCLYFCPAAGPVQVFQCSAAFSPSCLVGAVISSSRNET